MNRRFRTILGLVAALMAVEVQAAATRQSYILLFRQPNASAPAEIAHDVPLLGGSVDARGSDRILVTLPDAAVEGLRKSPRVKYLQRALAGIQAVPPAPIQATSSKLQPASEARPLEKAAQWASGTYQYDAAGNITAIGSDVYSYDSLSRLTGATVSGHTVSYGYDAYGNMTSRTTDGQSVPRSVDNNNHVAGAAYDSAGNLSSYAGETYAFDPFNNLAEKNANSTSEVYLYTASDERIGTRTGPDHWLWSLRDENGLVLRQYESSQSAPEVGWTWIEDYVYRDGQLLGAERMAEEGGRRHFHLDHLGTPRLITGYLGQIVATHDYYPFGDEITSPRQETDQGFSREEPMKFTGHERDFTPGTSFPESNYLDYMHARHASSGWSQFLSMDVADSTPKRPQSWNRYLYAEANPVNRTDPSGRTWAIVETYKLGVLERLLSGSLDTVEDLALFTAGKLPPVSAGTNEEAANLADTPGMTEIREQFIANGCQGNDSTGKRKVFSANYDYSEFGQTGRTLNGTGQLVGGFNAFLRPVGGGNILVYAYNYWGRASASRLPKELAGFGAPSNRPNPTLQDMMAGRKPWVYPPSSVFNNVSTGFFATTKKNYIWIEPLPCGCN